MGIGPAGPAILFMFLFMTSIVVGVFVLAYAARCVLVVVQETGLGQDDFIWPNDPYVDWLFDAVLFLELVGIWLFPAVLTARVLRHDWLTDEGALRVLILAGPGLWLFFPIGLMSSLSAISRWIPFRWSIFLCFLRVAPAAISFYAVTAILLGVCVVPWYYGLIGSRFAYLPVAAVVSALVLFIYARLLGRLAWIIQQLPSPQRATVKEKALLPPQPRRKKKSKRKPNVENPWAMPEEEEQEHKRSEEYPWSKKPPAKPKPGFHIPTVEELGSYGIAREQPAQPEAPPEKPPRSRYAQPPEEYSAYEFKGIPEPEPPPPPDPQNDIFAEQVRQRIAERTRQKPVVPPHPFVRGVYSFPFYSTILPNCLALALGFLGEGAVVYLMIEFGRDLFHW